MHKLVVIIIGLLLLTACTSNKEMSGLSTTSAMLLAVPLAPIAGTYLVVTDDSGKAKRKIAYWKDQLDPVYLEKTTQLLSKNPQHDAERAFAQSKVVFMPTLYGVSVYPGLDFDLDREFGEQNQAIINRNLSLVELQSLLAKAPVHLSDAGIPYRSDTYLCFRENMRLYKIIFNTTMFKLGASSELNPPGFSIKNYQPTSQCPSNKAASWSLD
ncbi:hypothetical protein CBP31_10095 [Oceanisphaera profunda]|uniref:Lipoprotein n=1 Tax=Oceanisphaera profunda TaxID=1416627 RepID=A0A1Y0D5W6_9GAMM|nr:hypothetical protein [Oceanisphaera profunda]ART82930.1 hypothetical protein CBP31_10095 [Oceanisphaera profunda]